MSPRVEIIARFYHYYTEYIKPNFGVFSLVSPRASRASQSSFDHRSTKQIVKDSERKSSADEREPYVYTVSEETAIERKNK